MGLPITTSPDITLLDYDILYDISGGAPIVVLANRSVGNPSGATNLDNCTWWYTLTMPDGTYIHQGTESSPDITTDDWTTLETEEGEWPTPFGVPPYGQIEFSCSVPYKSKLYVKDSDGNIFSLEKKVTICRPTGNTEQSLGNFGAANVAVTVKCDIAKIYANDTTNYTYQNRFGEFDSNTWKLAYPMDAEGNDPQVVTVENEGRVIFGVGYSAKGYQLNLGTFATYEMGDGQSIKIQYKFNRVFAVLCNIDLCQLTCEIDKLYKLLPSKCGTVDNPEIKDKLLRINTLLGQCFIGINQPLCGIDVPAKIEEIKKIGGFTCNCGIGGGINPIASTDGDINLSLDLEGGITGNVTNVGNNYVIHLAVPGAAAGTLQVVTDNGNVTTNDILVGDASALNTVLKPSGIRIGSGLSPYGGLERLGSDAFATLFLSNVPGGTWYLRPHASTNTYVTTMPQDQGAAGQVMVNDGAGNMSWVTPAATTPNLQAVTTAGNTTTNSIKIGGIAMNSVVISANYSVAITDFEILCDASAPSIFTVTLPNSLGSVFSIKLLPTITVGFSRVTIVVSGGGTIDGLSSYLLKVPNQSVLVKCSSSGVYSVLSWNNKNLTIPTITAGAALGVGSSASVSGTDKHGTITLTVVTPSVVTTPSIFFVYAFAAEYDTQAVMQVFPKNDLASRAFSRIWNNSSNQFTGQFTIDNPSVLTAGNLIFSYQMVSTD